MLQYGFHDFQIPGMHDKHYDAVIIGSGPGGEGAAMKLAKSGRKVALVEEYQRVGGGCTHWGTIPSKSLRHNVQRLMEFRSNPLFQHLQNQLAPEYPDLLKAAEKVIQDQVDTRYRHYARNKVDLFTGRGELADAHTIKVRPAHGDPFKLGADHVVIATGSRPYHPENVDFDDPRIVDSDTVLGLAHTPDSVTIYGAGVIGCEYASIFCNLDVKVTLVNTRDRLLSFLDDEITDALSYHLRDQGVVIRHNETMKSINASGSSVTLLTESGKAIKSDILLWCNGRSGNAQNMGLEAVGVETNHRGQISVDKVYRTAVENIFAVGDVAGPPGLASAAYDQGRFVGAMIATGECDWRLIEEFPTGIFTSPEISSLGRTEAELTEKGVPYEVGHAMFKHIARAQITGRTTGMLKILFHRETLEILGIHCFGDNASEIIHIGQVILHQKDSANTVRYFTETTFNYPTMAEAYRVAALNGLNRLR